MKRYFVLASIPVLLLAAIAFAQSFGIFGQWFNGTLTGLQEVPSVSTVASATFDADLSHSLDLITWRLSYSGLEGDVQQAHIHVGQAGVNGGISVWLCSNLASPPTPAGTQPCPAPPATITGFIRANNVVGPAAQGIDPGEFAELIRMMQAGRTYANIHSTRFPGGEVRAQLRRGRLEQNGQNGLLQDDF